MNTQSMPWVDKYRPNRIRNIVHQNELMRTLRNILETGEMPHLLFHGPPGTGKTTTILALAHELFGQNKVKERILELNASDDRGISVVRNEILTFAKMSIGNVDPNYKCPPFKILILDEADAMTPDAQSALRKIMEETSNVTRFCLICNYVDKIIEPIISRCMQYRFIPIDNKNMISRLKFISKKENIDIDEHIYDLITNVVEGDLRKGIMLLQNVKYFSKSGKQIDSHDIYDLVGYAPESKIKNLLEQCGKSSIVRIINLGETFNSYGYSTYIICSQIGKEIIKMENIGDNVKSNILKKIAKTQCMLNDRANENIQFINLLIFIYTQFNQCN